MAKSVHLTCILIAALFMCKSYSIFILLLDIGNGASIKQLNPILCIDGFKTCIRHIINFKL